MGRIWQFVAHPLSVLEEYQRQMQSTVRSRGPRGAEGGALVEFERSALITWEPVLDFDLVDGT